MELRRTAENGPPLEFKRYVDFLERKYDDIAELEHADSGGKYMAFRYYLSERGTEHSTSPPCSKNQNGIIERLRRALLESARSMVEYAGLTRKFRAEPGAHASDIRNHFFCTRGLYDVTGSAYERV